MGKKKSVSKTKSSGTSSSSATPYQGHYLDELYEEAYELAERPLEFFPDSTVAERSEQTLSGLDFATQRATEGSPNVRAAQDYNLRSMRGDFLFNNPNLDKVIGNVGADLGRFYDQSVRPGINSQFYGAGRGGPDSGAYGGANRIAQGEIGERFGEIAGNIRYGDYGRERGYQEDAVRQSIALADYDYRDIDRLLAVGQAEDVYAQRLTNAARERFEFGQQEPWERLAGYQRLIGSPYGGTTESEFEEQSKTVSYQKTPVAQQILGGVTGALGAIGSLYGGGGGGMGGGGGGYGGGGGGGDVIPQAVPYQSQGYAPMQQGYGGGGGGGFYGGASFGGYGQNPNNFVNIGGFGAA